MFHRCDDIGIRVSSQPEEGPSNSYSCDICNDGCWCSETEVDLHKKTVHRLDLIRISLSQKNNFICGEPRRNAETLQSYSSA
ncbi:unnamed protein product [Leptidea sinapis]|uniref:Uncharacterized protein n=1 Tax=Leptidea sinapis TaxID=189913 RepID=A0A5E4PP34_9NEOP|nr:unnamed protein product [Leptidea sinapis]